MRRLVLSVLSLAFLAACQPGVAPLTDEDVAAFGNLRTALVQATLAGDCDAVAAIYAESAVSLPQDAPIVEGRTAIRAACEAEEATTQDFSITSLQVDGYGDLAFDRGTWSQTFVSEGMAEPVTITGKYLVIYRKQADGSWICTVEIWNLDAPFPPPEQP
jgi:ketosteroid isomerase-like protein